MESRIVVYEKDNITEGRFLFGLLGEKVQKYRVSFQEYKMSEKDYRFNWYEVEKKFMTRDQIEKLQKYSNVHVVK